MLTPMCALIRFWGGKRMTVASGVCLTQCYDLNQLFDAQRRGKHTAVKVVTGWGVHGGWNDAARRAALASVPFVIVRSVAGDPSFQEGAARFPEASRLIAEFAPWYALRRDIVMEIGNEPNIGAWAGNDEYMWAYRWHLSSAIDELRKAFPGAKFCAPAPILDRAYNPERWLDVCADTMRRYDYVAMHAYEYFSFTRTHVPRTNQLADGIRWYGARFANVPWLLTEYGINDRATSAHHKGEAYARFVKSLPAQFKAATYYHVCVASDVHPEYHVWPLGDDAYGKVIA